MTTPREISNGIFGNAPPYLTVRAVEKKCSRVPFREMSTTRKQHIINLITETKVSNERNNANR